ncbi:AEC family transporter [uncultured Dysosmobacter sp.]|uniref:AEC family transporter n=1 Tax=uncultured Dysosmobacter sp. TaxID=2591384 RepID=UPI002629F63E|nr:AEC family transporter [uncultured Dysosmobacter sp.]
MLVFILLRQICIMALLVAVGVFLSRKGFLSAQGSKDLGSILLRMIIPCVILKSYLIQYSRKRLEELALSAGLALAGFVLAMLIAYAVYGKRRRIENFAAAFCNAGFIGIPLAQAVIGEEGVFYVATSIALLNLFQWTYGVYIMTDRRDAVSAKAIVKNPVVISIVIGVVLFVSRISVPDVITSTLGYIAGMNTPVAMILMGTYMAKLTPKQMFNRRAYGCVLFRLIFIPAVILLLFWIVPIQNKSVALAVYLAAATPVGANICVFAQQYNCDYEFSVVTVCLSTVLSIITVPVMVTLAQIAI